MTSLNDLSDAIDDCSVDLTGTRYLAPTVVDGRVTAVNTDVALSLRGSIQPLSGRDLMLLPEGMRNQNRKKLYTSTLLRTVETSSSKIADRVVYQSKTYQVDKVSDFEDLGNYYKVELVEMGQ